MYSISGDNPTTLYKNVVDYVSENGDKISPRGKLVSEVRPACIEFLNPLNRVTFLATRRINPFFQLAESFQILSGINDAEWLSKFNANMMSFSDDGKSYNAFYGERIRHWGDGIANNTAAYGRDGEGALDQFTDCYKRLLEDKDTRQATIAIGNPTFDNYKYLNEEHGKDIACLTGDTLVSTPNGNIQIKDIKIGQEVYTFNRCNSTVEKRIVTASAMTRKNAELIEIKTTNETIRCTPDHKFFTESASNRPIERRAEDLEVGEMVYLLSEGNLDYMFMAKTPIRSIKKISEREDVYDITVDGHHNFFANRMLVHNCNLYITFKIRDDKLHTTVFNRSNDVHWGTFGANLPQFSTIQEAMCSCLRNSGKEEFKNLTVGSYNQITDSLHIYLDDYGSKITNDVKSYYEKNPYEEFDFTCETEPRMSFDIDGFYDSISFFWEELNQYIIEDEIGNGNISAVLGLIDLKVKQGCFDPYFAFTAKSMLAYRLIKNKRFNDAIDIMYILPNCQWKVSMMHFMKKFIENVEDDMDKKILIGRYGGIIHNISMALVDQSGENKKALYDYLSF